MKKLIVCIMLFLLTMPAALQAQGYNQERIALENFLVRMYKNNPVEGVKIVEDYENR